MGAEYAFPYLLKEFSFAFSNTIHSFKGMSILATDGTHSVYSTNSEFLQDYNKPHLVDHRGYNHMHVNEFVDVISKSILALIIQSGQHSDERGALHQMIDHFEPEAPPKYIITADNSYESYDLLFHCELKKFYYVFRVKAHSSSKSMLSSFINELPDDHDAFDIENTCSAPMKWLLYII